MELGALSRVFDKLDFAIDDPHTSIFNEDFKKIGVGQNAKTYQGLTQLDLKSGQKQASLPIQMTVRTSSQTTQHWPQVRHWPRARHQANDT
eukprot:11045208-Ditylum_brightwellii.AAC.1